jgi:hypothetical protein
MGISSFGRGVSMDARPDANHQEEGPSGPSSWWFARVVQAKLP